MVFSTKADKFLTFRDFPNFLHNRVKLEIRSVERGICPIATLLS